MEIWRGKQIGTVGLAAPDVDVELVSNAGLDGSNRVPRRMTLYASSEDRALSLSGRLLSMARLGNPFKMISTEELGALRRAEGRTLVDVSPSQKRYREFLDHSYFHKNPWVSSDLLMFIKYGLSPADRGLVPFEEGALWTFSEDYPERAKNIRIAPPEKGLSEPVLPPAEPLLPVDPGEPLGEIQIEGL